MKRILVMCFMLVIVLVMVGCNNENEKVNNRKDEKQEIIDKTLAYHNLKKNSFNLSDSKIQSINLGKNLYSSILININNKELINDIFEIVNLDYSKNTDSNVDIINAFYIEILYEDNSSDTIYILAENKAYLIKNNDKYLSENNDFSKIIDLYYEELANMIEDSDIDGDYSAVIDNKKWIKLGVLWKKL